MGPALNICIETYGCQMNLSDTELVTRLLEDERHVLCQDPSRADVILVNTCAVREGAEQRVLAQLGRYKTYKQERPELIIGVLGCMSVHLSDLIPREHPHVDLVVGPDQYRKLPGVLRDLLVSREGRHILTRRDRSENYDRIYPSRRSGTNAWVTIMRGCDNMCSFCIVPFTRGRERSRSLPSILEECRRLAAEGFREVTLLGQNVNSYRDPDWRGVDEAGGIRGAHFPELLRAVSGVEGLRRIRFTSPHPKDFSAEMVREMAENPKVCKHMHLPLQVGNDRVLRRMRRGYTGEEFLRLVERAREAMPELGLSTDLIVGFPGETKAEFEDTLRLVERIRFDGAFTFEYSPRPGAPSAAWEDDVPPAEKNRRLRRLIEVQRRITDERSAACRGRSFEVLVESTSKKSDNELMGRSSCNRVVVFPADGRYGPGSLVRVEVEDVVSFTLRGRVTHVEGKSPA